MSGPIPLSPVYASMVLTEAVSPLTQDRQCTYNVSLWRVRVTVAAMETQHYFLCVWLSVTVNNINVLIVAQKNCVMANSYRRKQ